MGMVGQSRWWHSGRDNSWAALSAITGGVFAGVRVGWSCAGPIPVAAISAAIGKARDYATALGATLRHVEHIADAGLLGDTAPYHTVYNSAFRASGGDGQPGTPALTPVPQELIATLEARFRTTDVSLPGA